MTEHRKLAAILVADIVGFSRLVGINEERTLSDVREINLGIVDPNISLHNGRLVKRTGDGVLVEFRSVVEAVRCAIALQDAMQQRNDSGDEAQRIEYRIGVHLGDVIEEGDGDLMGDGVNIAARLEALATPGAICISEDAYRQIRSRLDVEITDLGEHELKNIAEPMRVYAVYSGTMAAPDVVSGKPPTTLVSSSKPCIAVLPFTNMSADPEQDYFADGIVEELTTGLARIRWLTVISRNSAFAFKDKAMDVRRIGRDLSVGYIVEGSVRKAANSVRISAKMIDTGSGAQLWGEAFTGRLDDIFDLQDEVTAGIVAAVEPSLKQAEIDRAKRKRPESLSAYDLYLRALDQAYKFTQEARDSALKLLDEAIKIDPDYPEAHGVAAFCCQQRYLWGGRDLQDKLASLHHAEAVAAGRTDDATPLSFAAMALSALDNQHEVAATMLARALDLSPNSALALICRSLVMTILGKPEEGAVDAAQSLRLSPFDPLRHIPECVLAVAMLAVSNSKEAVGHARRAVDANPMFTPARATLALCLVEDARIEEAADVVRTVLAKAPDTRISNLQERLLIANGLGFDRVATAMRLAGLPE